jgi:hypothetical protein
VIYLVGVFFYPCVRPPYLLLKEFIIGFKVCLISREYQWEHGTLIRIVMNHGVCTCSNVISRPVFLKLPAVSPPHRLPAHRLTTIVKLLTPKSGYQKHYNVIKVTITTFSLHWFEVFSTLMIKGQEVTERTNSPTFCWRSTNRQF